MSSKKSFKSWRAKREKLPLKSFCEFWFVGGQFLYELRLENDHQRRK